MPTIAHRSRVIVLAVALAVAGVAVPLSALVFYSDARAGREEQERLDGIAARMVTRASHVLKESVELLHTLDALDIVPCSPRHIGHMRSLTLNARSVGEIGHFENGLLACTSWGVTETLVPQGLPDFMMDGDIAVTVNMVPQVSHSRPVIALQYRGNNVLINPVQLVDVLGEPNVHMVLATKAGQVLSQLNEPDPNYVAQLLRHIEAGASPSSDDNNVLGIARIGELVAVAIEPKQFLTARLAQERQGLLPVGAVIAAITVAIVVWLLRRRASPVGELAIAVRKREFEVHYQPIIALQTGHCVGAEALVRWRRPDGSLVRPDLFIPLAEETGLITPITDQVLANVVHDLGSLLAKHPSLHVAINVAAEDITSGRILDMAKQRIPGSGIRPDQVWLEATERGLLEESARQTLAGRVGAPNHYPSTSSRLSDRHRRLRNRLCRPVLFAGVPVRRAEDRQVFHRHHRYRLGHQQRDPTYHQHGTSTATELGRRRCGDSGPGRLPHAKRRRLRARLAVFQATARPCFYRLLPGQSGSARRPAGRPRRRRSGRSRSALLQHILDARRWIRPGRLGIAARRRVKRVLRTRKSQFVRKIALTYRQGHAPEARRNQTGGACPARAIWCMASCDAA